jgi:predicted PolB exonuclease-like 3'-5' exonuclease
MNDAKLSDFTTKELQLLMIAVIEQMERAQNSLRQLSQFDDGEFKTDQSKYWNNYLDTYQLWHVQILDALVIVKQRELINLN